MNLFYKVIILVSCIFYSDLTYAAECTVTIKSQQEVFELPKIWCFKACDDLDYKDIHTIRKDGTPFSPYDNWTDFVEFEKYTGNSWYGLTITIANVTSDFALFLPWQSRGTQVYINGKLIHETRSFDKNGTTAEIIGKPSLIVIPKAVLIKGDNNLVLRTGSLNNIGGINYPILFGRYESVQEKWNLFIIWNSFLASIDIFLFIYFIIILFKRKKEKYYLYFSFLSLSLGVWIFGYSGIILFIIDNQFAFIISTYFASIVASISFINFISHFFNIKERFISIGMTILFLSLIALITLEYIMSGKIYYYQKYLYDPFMMMVVITVVYGLYLCIRAVMDKRPYSKRILLGVSVYSMGFLLSLPLFLNIFEMKPVLIESFFVMTVIFATVLASRFAQVHNDLESLNVNLVEINHEKDRAIDNLNIYKYIVSESRDHMAFINADRRFIEVNNALLKAYDRKRTSVINENVSMVFGGDEYEISLKEYFDACLSGEPVVFERWQEFPLRGRRYMITSLLPYMAGSERKVGIVYYSIDITDRIMFEQELVKISENERNAIGIELHDNLAQKLFGIALKISVLASDSDGKQKDAALEIEGLINGAIAYIRNIAKSLSRIDFIDGGFVTLLKELKSLMERRYNIQLNVNIDCDIDIKNRIHYSQIYYIIQEAVINSVKHSGAKAIHIIVKRLGDDIHLLIKDDGVGIPDRVDEGRGIGLKIMKYRARMIGSSISIRRGAEGGTEVLCTIPA